ncbi:hypothetical protein CPB83DRAFT_900795 [Crepidotus variabilis]|uniref:Uncharacterized protein n=1 Tax=Crepidotus variabilis TaxID=179855 RepID=A0A9P6BBM3_9AGAR|nr:hypothetical protein CPB83DRAFT_900795 [Crepidotus variabilis]
MHIRLSDLHSNGLDVKKLFDRFGYFPPDLSPQRTSPFESCSQDFPGRFPSVRGLRSTSFARAAASGINYLPPLRPNDALDKTWSPFHNESFYTTITNLSRSHFPLILQRTITITAYSPRDFLLLVKGDIPKDLASVSWENLHACSVTLLQAFERWSVWIPQNLLITTVNICIKMCGLLVIPGVIRTSFSTTFVFSLAREIFDTVMATLQRIDYNERSSLHHTRRKELGDWVHRGLLSIMTFMPTVTILNDTPPEWKEAAFQMSSLMMAQF